MTKVSIDRLEGGETLCTWFEASPCDYDKLRELQLRQCAPGRLVAHTVKMKSSLNSDGYILITKHLAVAFTVFDLVAVGLTELQGAGHTQGMDIEATATGITLHFDSTHGVQGWMTARRITVSFAPGRSADAVAT